MFSASPPGSFSISGPRSPLTSEPGTSLFALQVSQLLPQGEERPMVEALDRSLGPSHNAANFSIGQILGILKDQQLLSLLGEAPDRLH